MIHYADYFWREGIPVGYQAIPQETDVSFRIISDPYKKRFSLEKYQAGLFKETIYDSNLFDFRQLKKADEAWQRQTLREDKISIRSLIRSIDERVILIEEAHFEGEECRYCKLYSPHNILLATQKILHQSLGDTFDGVLLYDILDHPILIKHYNIDTSSGAFTTLLKEEWKHLPIVHPR